MCMDLGVLSVTTPRPAMATQVIRWGIFDEGLVMVPITFPLSARLPATYLQAPPLEKKKHGVDLHSHQIAENSTKISANKK